MSIHASRSYAPPLPLPGSASAGRKASWTHSDACSIICGAFDSHAEAGSLTKTMLAANILVDNGLVTSHQPSDLPAFNRKMIKEIVEGPHNPELVETDSEEPMIHRYAS